MNKMRLLKLTRLETLENFVLLKSDLFEEYPYLTLNRNNSNIRHTMKYFSLSEGDKLLDLKIPSQSNFNRIYQKLILKPLREQAFCSECYCPYLGFIQTLYLMLH